MLRGSDRGWLGLLVLSGGSTTLEQDIAAGRLVIGEAELGMARARLPLGTTRWSGIQRVPWDLVVPAGAHLQVAPGAQVSFASLDLAGRGRHPELTELIIEGQLTVDGGLQPVAFVVASGGPFDLWYGIRMEGDAIIDLEGLEMTGAGFALQGDVFPAGSVRVVDSRFSSLVNGLNLTLFTDVQVDDSDFRRITGPAIRANGFGTMRVRNTAIEFNGQEGVWLSNASFEGIGLSVRQNGQLAEEDPRSGIFAEGGAGQRLELWDSAVEANRAHGIDAQDWLGEIELHRTSVSSNRADGLRVDGAERMVFEDVELSRNLGRGADLAATTVEMWTTTATDNVGGGARIRDGARVAVDMSHFSGNTLLLSGTGLSTVRNSEFSATGVALQTVDASPEIVANRFENNTTAIRVEGQTVPSTIRANTFIGNGTAVDNRSGQTLTAPGNFWGTADSTAIARQMAGAVDFGGYLESEPVITAIAPAEATPDRSALSGNRPNPFNGQTLISFSLASPTPVELSVFDITGQLVWTYRSGVALTAGLHEIAWHGLDTMGRPLASGVYLYELATSTSRLGSGRMMLLR